MQHKVLGFALLMLEFNMAVPLQQPIAAAGYNNNTADTGDLDIAKGAADQSDLDGYANGDADTGAEQTSANRPTEVEPFHVILSFATGMFVAITKSGTVQAKTRVDKLVAHFYRTHSISDDGKQYVTLESRKHSDKGWYLTLLENGKFRGSVPSGGNERFEMVSLDSAIALKANRKIAPSNDSTNTHVDHTNMTINGTNNSTNSSGSESGSGYGSSMGFHNGTEALNNTQFQDCYLGFSIDTGRASCYNSTSYSEVRLLFIDGTASG